MARRTKAQLEAALMEVRFNLAAAFRQLGIGNDLLDEAGLWLVRADEAARVGLGIEPSTATVEDDDTGRGR